MEKIIAYQRSKTKEKGYMMHPVPLYGDREIKLYKDLLVKGYK
jgi:hypothetical protein